MAEGLAETLRSLRVAHHASCVAPGGTFVALRGQRVDGVDFIPEAIARGARRVVVACDATIPVHIQGLLDEHGITLERVEQPRRALAELSAAAYGYPARRLTLIGITGTVGKTSTAHLTFHLLRSSGIRAALLSSVYNVIGDTQLPTELTTQQPDYLHAFFAAAQERGVTHVVVEVAAQAVSLDRIGGLSFAAVAWTNFFPEHGEFYATSEEYFAAKRELLTRIQPGGVALVPEAVPAIATLPLPVGVRRLVMGREVVLTGTEGVQVKIAGVLYSCPSLMGLHHAANVAMGVLLAQECGVSPAPIQAALATFPGVPGRGTMVSLPRGVKACIDYAYTPVSVEGVLRSLRGSTSQLIVISGCGGDRDRAKRPLMGRIMAECADLCFFTTDNPRSEDPAQICAEMVAGVADRYRARVLVELDRAVAIAEAYRRAEPGAVLVLLGKGPDEYQQVGTVKYPFSERAILAAL